MPCFLNAFYLPPEVVRGIYNGLFVDSLGFVAVDKIKKHLLGFTQSNILTLALISAITLLVWAECSPLQVFLIIASFISLDDSGMQPQLKI